MTYVYRNAKYINAEGTRIDCELNLDIEEGWTPYTLDTFDPDKTINNEALLAQMLEAGDIAAYIAPTPPTQEEIDAENAATIRLKRDSLLVSYVDPFVTNPLRWADLTEEEQTSVNQYRIDLLNITEQETFPSSVVWPTMPEVLILS